MAGTGSKSLPKRCSRVNYNEKFKRYKAEDRLRKNSDAGILRHELELERQKSRKREFDKLYSEVCEKYNLDSKGKYALKRLIGTVNISRLTALLSHKIKTESWFIERNKKMSDNACKLIFNTKLSIFLILE